VAAAAESIAEAREDAPPATVAAYK